MKIVTADEILGRTGLIVVLGEQVGSLSYIFRSDNGTDVIGLDLNKFHTKTALHFAKQVIEMVGSDQTVCITVPSFHVMTFLHNCCLAYLSKNKEHPKLNPKLINVFKQHKSKESLWCEVGVDELGFFEDDYLSNLSEKLYNDRLKLSEGILF